MRIQKALLSVSDKTGLLDIAAALHKLQVELIASGGTAKTLTEAGYPVTPVEKLSGKGEAFQGRMKTISFEIASALLFRRDDPADIKTASELDIAPIDLVVVNLYPFHETLKKQAGFSECIENIDIGGPTLLRAAAKNHSSVTVLCDPRQYIEFLQELENHQGATSSEFRKKCATDVFAMTAFYDMTIAGFLQQQGSQGLRYGENPQQKATVLADPFSQGLAHYKSLQGKEMSYNNYLDADFALQSLKDLIQWQGVWQDGYAHPTAVVVKHNTPCGLAISETSLRALEMAWKGDEKSSFGGILALSFPVTLEIAQFLSEKFIEVVLAPSFSMEAQNMFKKNVRLVQVDLASQRAAQSLLETAQQIRSIDGGVLLQDKDSFAFEKMQTVTDKKFSHEKEKLAAFAMLCVKNLKSNAIALCRQQGSDLDMVTLGSGQTNRIDCIEKLIIPRLADKDIHDVSEMVLASDAFFPFADSVEVAAKVGVKYVVQPGGSVKDSEVIAEANRRGLAMMFTGRRHFLH